MSTKISRQVTTGAVIVKDFKSNEEIWRKAFSSKPSSEDMIKAQKEFTDKHWDKETLFMLDTVEETEIYEWDLAKIIKYGKKITGEAKAKRLAQIEKQKKARSKAK